MYILGDNCSHTLGAAMHNIVYFKLHEISTALIRFANLSGNVFERKPVCNQIRTLTEIELKN